MRVYKRLKIFKAGKYFSAKINNSDFIKFFLIKDKNVMMNFVTIC